MPSLSSGASRLICPGRKLRKGAVFIALCARLGGSRRHEQSCYDRAGDRYRDYSSPGNARRSQFHLLFHSDNQPLSQCGTKRSGTLTKDLHIYKVKNFYLPPNPAGNQPEAPSKPQKEQENTQAGKRSMNPRIEHVAPYADLCKQTQCHVTGGCRAQTGQSAAPNPLFLPRLQQKPRGHSQNDERRRIHDCHKEIVVSRSKKMGREILDLSRVAKVNLTGNNDDPRQQTAGECDKLKCPMLFFSRALNHGFPWLQFTAGNGISFHDVALRGKRFCQRSIRKGKQPE